MTSNTTPETPDQNLPIQGNLLDGQIEFSPDVVSETDDNRSAAQKIARFALERDLPPYKDRQKSEAARDQGFIDPEDLADLPDKPIYFSSDEEWRTFRTHTPDTIAQKSTHAIKNMYGNVLRYLAEARRVEEKLVTDDTASDYARKNASKRARAWHHRLTDLDKTGRIKSIMEGK